MAKRSAQKFTVGEFRLGMQRAGKSVQAIADELKTTRGTVYHYLRKYPELKAAFEGLGGAVETRERFSREAAEKAIADTRGNITAIAQKMGCERQTVYNLLQKYPDLNDLIRAERERLVDTAELKLFAALQNGDMRAVLFTLETLGRGRGWTRRTEVTGADGGALVFSSDVMELIRARGLDMSEVVRQFEAMVRMAAEVEPA